MLVLRGVGAVLGGSGNGEAVGCGGGAIKRGG